MEGESQWCCWYLLVRATEDERTTERWIDQIGCTMLFLLLTNPLKTVGQRWLTTARGL